MSNQPQPESNFTNQQLRQQIANAFDMAGLRGLCYDVEISFEELGGESQGSTAVIVKLLEAAERNGKLEALFATCARERPGLNWPIGPQPGQPCPYRGLFAFQEKDRHLFFGRETFTEMLTEFVLARPLTAVIGPSGSGKSSVVFAGLVPALRQVGEWLVVKFRPGERPFHTLAAVLLPHLDLTLSKVDQLAETKKLANQLLAGNLTLADIIPSILEQQPSNTHLLLIADQFEELYTLCPDAETRHRFLDLLLNQTTDRDRSETRPYNTHLVCTLRADFMGQALAYPPLVAALQNNDVKLGPMTAAEFHRAIVEPAREAHIQFEEGLVNRILDDVGVDGRNLPLLEFALTELWQQQSNRNLSHAAYERIGQVRGALARHADTVYNNLTTEEQIQAERIFVQLVHPGAGAEDTRRLATKADIDEADWVLVQHLANANSRLLVTDRDESGQSTAEVIHEALIQRWQRLRRWMNTHREFRAWQERLRIELDFWINNDQKEDYLLSGGALAIAKEQLKNHSQKINALERDFILESIQSDNKLQEVKLAFIKRLETQARITPIISASIDIDLIFHNFIQEILIAIPKAKNACIVEYFQEENDIVITSSTQIFYSVYASRTDEGSFRINLSKRRGIVGRAIETKSFCNVPNVSQDSDYIQVIPTTKSEIAVPIHIDGKINYIIVVESDQEAAFSYDEEDLLITLSSHVALAVKNATHFRRAQALELTKQTAMMATGLVHDINNAVAAFPDLIDEIAYKHKNNRDISAPLANLQKSARVTDKISARLKDFIFTGAYRPELFDVATLIQNAIDLSKPQKPPHVFLVKNIAPELPKVRVDNLWIEMLLKNLFINAFAAIPDTREGLVIISAEVDESNLHIHVRDNGIGMEPELQKEIFKFGTSSKSDSMHKMHGVGLYHCYLIAQVHRGKITVESKPDIGSDFKLALPLK